MLPLASSSPLATMSYALARTFSGSVSSRGRSSSNGMVNGWCMNVSRPQASSRSNHGNSTTNAQPMTSLVDQIEALRQLAAQRAQTGPRHVHRIGDQEHQIAFAGLELRPERLLLALD